MQDTGFPMTERDRLGLRGLLPPRVISFEQQYDRFSKFEEAYSSDSTWIWFSCNNFACFLEAISRSYNVFGFMLFTHL